jgi:hypothetical protein
MEARQPASSTTSYTQNGNEVVPRTGGRGKLVETREAVHHEPVCDFDMEGR